MAGERKIRSKWDGVHQIHRSQSCRDSPLPSELVLLPDGKCGRPGGTGRLERQLGQSCPLANHAVLKDTSDPLEWDCAVALGELTMAVAQAALLAFLVIASSNGTLPDIGCWAFPFFYWRRRREQLNIKVSRRWVSQRLNQEDEAQLRTKRYHRVCQLPYQFTVFSGRSSSSALFQLCRPHQGQSQTLFVRFAS